MWYVSTFLHTYIYAFCFFQHSPLSSSWWWFISLFLHLSFHLPYWNLLEYCTAPFAQKYFIVLIYPYGFETTRQTCMVLVYIYIFFPFQSLLFYPFYQGCLHSGQTKYMIYLDVLAKLNSIMLLLWNFSNFSKFVWSEKERKTKHKQLHNTKIYVVHH